jgi:flagellar basal-body rod protein FlgG
MNRALEIAASGMSAQQANLEVVAHNLANADVAGFKASVATFAEVAAGDVRLGTIPTGSHPLFSQGKLEKSGGPFDLAIDGDGFFEVRRGSQRAYTRDGAFSRAADGTVRNAAGWQLEGVRIPADAQSVRVEPDGRVYVDRPHHAAQRAGHVGVTLFPAAQALQPIGDGLFLATPEAGAAVRLGPGAPGGPRLAFGMLERSNVSIAEAMMEILAAQRAYEANAKGVQAADEMQRIADNIHRD